MTPQRTAILAILDATAKRHGIPADILRAIAWQESTMNPLALGSDGHGRGLMQIDNLVHPGFANDSSLWKNPAANAEKGADILVDFMRAFPQEGWLAAAGRYNAGWDPSREYETKIAMLMRTKPWETE